MGPFGLDIVLSPFFITALGVLGGVQLGFLARAWIDINEDFLKDSSTDAALPGVASDAGTVSISVWPEHLQTASTAILFWSAAGAIADALSFLLLAYAKGNRRSQLQRNPANVASTMEQDTSRRSDRIIRLLFWVLAFLSLSRCISVLIYVFVSHNQAEDYAQNWSNPSFVVPTAPWNVVADTIIVTGGPYTPETWTCIFPPRNTSGSELLRSFFLGICDRTYIARILLIPILVADVFAIISVFWMRRKIGKEIQWARREKPVFR